MKMNLGVLERVVIDGKRVISAAGNIRRSIKAAESEAKGNPTVASYFWLRAAQSVFASDSPEFQKFICPPALAEKFAKDCLAYVESQESGVEAEVMRLFQEAMDVEKATGKKDKEKKE